MSEYIKRIRTTTGDKQIDYNALANLPTLVTVDNALTESGKAADAKVVGDKLSALTQRSDANTLKGYAVGQTVSIDDVSPIEHGLNVRVHGKNLFDISKVPSIDGKLTNNNDGTLTVAENQYAVPTGKKINELCPSLKADNVYTLSFLSTSATTKYIWLNGADVMLYNSTYTFTDEMLNSELYLYGYRDSDDGYGSVCTISNIQIEEDTSASEYTSYVDPSTTTLTYGDKTYTPNSDGSVEGLMSTYPSMEMSVPDGFNVFLEYNQDTNAVIKKLTDAIVALGGTV